MKQTKVALQESGAANEALAARRPVLSALQLLLRIIASSSTKKNLPAAAQTRPAAVPICPPVARTAPAYPPSLPSPLPRNRPGARRGVAARSPVRMARFVSPSGGRWPARRTTAGVTRGTHATRPWERWRAGREGNWRGFASHVWFAALAWLVDTQNLSCSLVFLRANASYRTIRAGVWSAAGCSVQRFVFVYSERKYCALEPRDWDWGIVGFATPAPNTEELLVLSLCCIRSDGQYRLSIVEKLTAVIEGNQRCETKLKNTYASLLMVNFLSSTLTLYRLIFPIKERERIRSNGWILSLLLNSIGKPNSTNNLRR